MTIRYTPAARADLCAVRDWIVNEFCDDQIANASVIDIIQGIAVLKRNPDLARPLKAKIKRDAGYEYILCGKRSIAILRIEDNLASVIRILDTHTDYVRTLFGPPTRSPRNATRHPRGPSRRP